MKQHVTCTSFPPRLVRPLGGDASQPPVPVLEQEPSELKFCHLLKLTMIRAPCCPDHAW